MAYSLEHLTQINASYDEWVGKLQDVSDKFVLRSYITDRGKEFGTHGLSRRLSMIEHCIERAFSRVPLTEIQPSHSDLMDASAFIQTFMINIFGAVDNLAHIWCHEAQVRDAKGLVLKPGRIGLTPQHKDVRSSLSNEFRTNLTDAEEWFGYLENYRHALAHRIPLYIPPKILGPEAQTDLEKLQNRQSRASDARDWQQVNQLQYEMDRLGVFEPYIMHSFMEKAIPMRFHAQMVCDLATIVEMCENMLVELSRLASGPEQSMEARQQPS